MAIELWFDCQGIANLIATIIQLLNIRHTLLLNFRRTLDIESEGTPFGVQLLIRISDVLDVIRLSAALLENLRAISQLQALRKNWSGAAYPHVLLQLASQPVALLDVFVNRRPNSNNSRQRHGFGDNRPFGNDCRATRLQRPVLDDDFAGTGMPCATAATIMVPVVPTALRFLLALLLLLQLRIHQRFEECVEDGSPLLRETGLGPEN